MRTKHNHAVVFGRKEAGCPRCDELKAGAAPIKGWGYRNRELDAQRLRAIHAHDFVACAARNFCCTHFEH